LKESLAVDSTAASSCKDANRNETCDKNGTSAKAKIGKSSHATEKERGRGGCHPAKPTHVDMAKM
jgi:hypothetical protein